MSRRTAIPCGLVLVLSLGGCALHDPDEAWPGSAPAQWDPAAWQPARGPATAPSPKQADPVGPIDLTRALAAALSRNPGLGADRLDIQAAEARLVQADLPPNPELEFEAEEFAGTGELTGFDSAEVVLAVSQQIETGGKRAKRTRAAELDRDLAGWDYGGKRLDLVAEVRKAFVDVWVAQELLQVHRKSVALSEEVLNGVQKRVAAGKVAPLEQSNARVTLTLSRVELRGAVRELKTARARLAALWGSSTPRFERVRGALDSVAPVPAAEALSVLLPENPDLARWETEIQQRRANLNLERANGVPDVTVSLGVQHLRETDETALVFGVSVPLPIFDRNQGTAREARHRLVQAYARQQAARTRVRTEFVEAYQALADAFSRAATLRDDVLPNAKQAFQAARNGYTRGKFAYADVLDAQKNLFDTQAEYLSALGDYHKAVADVERLIGQDIRTARTTVESQPKESTQ